MGDNLFMVKKLELIHSKKLGVENIVETLSEASINNLIPILVKLMRDKASEVTPKGLLASYEEKNDIFGNASISQKELNKFQSLFFDVLPKKFESVQLSPIAPLGVCSSITKLSQDVRLSTIRKSEVVSDSTAVLSLEASRRRKKLMCDNKTMYQDVCLATFHRLLRLQQFNKSKGYLQHFEILGTITAGRRQGKNTFINDTIYEHIKMWIEFIRHLNKNRFCFKNVVFTFSHISLMETILNCFHIPREVINSNSLIDSYNYFKEFSVQLPKSVRSIKEIADFLNMNYEVKNLLNILVNFETTVINKLREEFSDVEFRYELDRKLGLGYFNGICFHAFADNLNNETVALIDGGVVDWIKQILSDNREMAVSSSFGVELGINKFKVAVDE
jgi:hypothetical protein